MRNHSRLVWFLSVLVVFVVFVPTISLAQNNSYSFTKGRSLSVAASLDGVSADDAGVITNSSLTVSSNKKTKTEIDLYKKMAIIRVEPIRPWLVMPRPKEVNITFSGLIPDQTYYLYKEKLHNPEVFTPGQDGSYSFLLETPRHRYLILKTNPSTYHIDNNATGGDCPQIGTWDDSNDTCTLSLTATIDQIIAIDDTGITLDGDGRLIAHADSIGIYANPGIFETVKNITVKNFRVAGMDIGISLIDVSDSLIDSVTVKSDTTGISLKDDEGMFVQNSTVWSNQVGFTSTNGTNIFLRRNNFKQNVNDLANISGDLDLEGSSTVRGNWWQNNTACQQDPNNPSYCTDSYTTAGHTDNLPWFCEDGWVTPCVAPPPPPPPPPTGGSGTWAEISSTTGTATLYESADTTSAQLKILPNSWAIKVLDNTGSTFWKVEDVTDNTVGWIEKGKLNSDITKQVELEDRATISLEDSVNERKEKILEAVKHYYTDSNIRASLYSGRDEANTFGTIVNIIPKELILAIASQESKIVAYDNSWVTYDVGLGIMQITSKSLIGISSKLNIPQCDSIVENDSCFNPKTFLPVLNENYNYIGRTYKVSFRYYVNSIQSVYSNIKDGIRVLLQKYKTALARFSNAPSGGYKSLRTGEIISADDMKIVYAVRAFNGVGDYCTPLHNPLNVDYLKNIGLYLNSAKNDFNLPLLDQTNVLSLANIISRASKEQEYIAVCSPAYLQVLNSSGQMTGYDGSVIVNHIQEVLYDEEFHRAANIIWPLDSYYFRIIGEMSGTYNLPAGSFVDDNLVQFLAEDIPVQTGSVHEYHIDWDALVAGKQGVSILIDQNGDGVFESEGKSGTLLTSQNFSNLSKKVMICHIPPGNSSNTQTIAVGKPALKAHLAHGDTIGRCSNHTGNKTEKK